MEIDLKDVYGAEEPAVVIPEATPATAAPKAPEKKPAAPAKEEKPVEEPKEASEDDFEDDFEDDEKDDAEEQEDESEEAPEEPEESATEPEKPAKQADIDTIIRTRTEEIRKQRDDARAKESDMRELLKAGLKEILKDGEDPYAGLKRIAAENKGTTVEEVEKELETKRLLEEFKQQRVASQYASVRQLHLSQIKEAYPGESASSIEQIPNFDKFKRLMSAGGFTPVEAYAITSAGALENKAATEYAKQKAMADSKAHLRPTNARSVAPSLLPIPKGDREKWEAAFPDLPYSELVKKYNAGKKI